MRLPRARSLALATVLGLAPTTAALAQISPLEIWGLDRGAPTSIYNFRDNCVTNSSCIATPPLLPGYQWPEGGIGEGICSQTLWATDGLTLANFDASCNLLLACNFPTGSPPVTALDIDEAAGVMYFADTSGVIFKAPLGCPVTPAPVCVLPASMVPVTGIDWDPFTGTVWVVTGSGVAANLSLAPGCPVNVSFPVLCPSGGSPGPFSGIAFDACKNILHFSNDLGDVVTMDAAGFPLNCCLLTSLGSSALTGLAHEPQRPVFLGNSCSGAGCPVCPQAIGARGDAVLGSPCYTVTLDQAPAGGTAWLAFGFTPGPTMFTPLCGPLQMGIGNGPYFFGPIPLGGTGTPCSGSAAVPFPLPLNQNLCGLTIYFQWIIRCTVLPLGVSQGMAVTLAAY